MRSRGNRRPGAAARIGSTFVVSRRGKCTAFPEDKWKNARTNTNDGDANAYELERYANITKNMEVMRSLNLHSLKAAMGSATNSSRRAKKASKTTARTCVVSEGPTL